MGGDGPARDGHGTDAVWVKQLEAGESYVEDAPSSELAAAVGPGRVTPLLCADAWVGLRRSDQGSLLVPKGPITLGI
jgi:hypothetical protein